MSLEYYLLCREKFDIIIANLNDIIQNYNDIFSYTNELVADVEYMCYKFQPKESKVQLELKLNHAKHCRTYCNRKINQICVHEFVTDTIDITPDNSQSITYCRICEYTKK